MGRRGGDAEPGIKANSNWGTESSSSHARCTWKDSLCDPEICNRSWSKLRLSLVMSAIDINLFRGRKAVVEGGPLRSPVRFVAYSWNRVGKTEGSRAASNVVTFLNVPKDSGTPIWSYSTTSSVFNRGGRS